MLIVILCISLSCLQVMIIMYHVCALCLLEITLYLVQGIKLSGCGRWLLGMDDNAACYHASIVQETCLVNIVLCIGIV